MMSYKGNMREVQYLLEANVDVNFKNPVGGGYMKKTFGWKAATRWGPPPSPPNPVCFGCTPLHMATFNCEAICDCSTFNCGCSKVDVMVALIEAGADTEAKNTDGRTPKQLVDYLHSQYQPEMIQQYEEALRRVKLSPEEAAMEKALDGDIQAVTEIVSDERPAKELSTVEKWVKILEAMDTNNDGVLTEEELLKFVRILSGDPTVTKLRELRDCVGKSPDSLRSWGDRLNEDKINEVYEQFGLG